jgi:ATP-dependent DNA helicase RecQ
MVRQIAVLGFLEKDVENYGVLKLSDKGRSYMKDPFPLTLSKDHDYENEKIEEDEEKEASGGSGSYDVALFELLKNLRKKLAKEKNLPPYVIFQDPSLEEMATTYPTTKDDMANINGVGMGKVVKFGRQFIDLIKKYVEDNEIETASEVVVKSAVNKSKIKIHIIQQVDRKVDLDIIADQKELAMAELIEEIEHICYSGTKLNLDYYINQVIEPDKQDEIFDYFMAAESDNIAVAMDECDIEDITEEELRLMRIKFLSEVAN